MTVGRPWRRLGGEPWLHLWRRRSQTTRPHRFLSPSSDRTPHTRNWHGSAMCHAPSTAGGTSGCRLQSSFVASRLCSSLEAGTRVLGAGRHSKTAVVTVELLYHSAPLREVRSHCLRPNWVLNSLNFAWKSQWRVGPVSVFSLCGALSSTCQTRQQRYLPFVGDVHPPSWPFTTPLGNGARQGSPRSRPRL